jgi:hypothetical protein
LSCSRRAEELGDAMPSSASRNTADIEHGRGRNPFRIFFWKKGGKHFYACQEGTMAHIVGREGMSSEQEREREREKKRERNRESERASERAHTEPQGAWNSNMVRYSVQKPVADRATALPPCDRSPAQPTRHGQNEKLTLKIWENFGQNVLEVAFQDRRPWERSASVILSLLMPPGAWRFSTMIKSMTHTPLLSQTNPEGCLRGTKKRN